jgi:hypothetical protein
MPKKSSKTSKAVVEILNPEDTNLPEVFAELAKSYYEAFLKQGFSTQQSFVMMEHIIRGYVIRS